MPTYTKRYLPLIVLLFCVAGTLQAQTQQQINQLQQLSTEFEQQWSQEYRSAVQRAQRIGIPVKQVLPDGRIIELQRFEYGKPVYYVTQNLDAAETSSTDDLWSGGGAGFSLSGNTETLGIWDGGAVRLSHQEFGNRVTQQDGDTSLSDHATHVAGTMIAEGVRASAKGMSFEASLDAYNWNSDNSEMSAAAANGLRVSNHSYGQINGWFYNSNDTTWYWYGDTTISQTADWSFGFYGNSSKSWDEIANNAPHYLIVKSSGNDRFDGPSSEPVRHKVWDATAGGWVFSNTVRNRDGDSNGFDAISPKGIAKNVLTIGAVDDISGGYTRPSDVVLAGFSSTGPADDGRIKPDLVANGLGLLSSIADADNAYDSYSGTSMATPTVSGSIGLLQELYRSLHGSTAPRAATIKALVIHTADEAGSSVGPDYTFGWGLLNTRKAAELLQKDQVDFPLNHINELTLNEGNTYEQVIWSDGSGPLRTTIAWNDPAGTPSSPQLDPADPKLVNDLDLYVTDENGTVYEAYIMDPANPGSAAGTGDNDRDNVEQVYIDAPAKGFYTVHIDHEGTLTNNSQAFSLIISGNTDTPGHLTFTGDGYLEVPNSSSIDISGHYLTVEFWVRFDPSADEDAVLITKKESGSDGFQIHLVGTGENRRIRFTPTWRSGLNLTSRQGIPANQWTHVAAVYNDGLAQLYFNGELDSETEESSTALGSTALNLIIGANHSKNDRFYRGSLDNIRIYDRAKTLFEIQDQFASELEGTESGLQGYYKFNILAPNKVGDYSGNGNDGSLVNLTSIAEPNVFPITPLVHGRTGDHQVELKIKERDFAAGKASEFRVYRRDNNGNPVRIATVSNEAGADLFTDDALNNRETHIYEVTSVDSAGNEGDFSNPLYLSPFQPIGGTSIDFTDRGYLNFGYNPVLDVDGRHLTIMFWIKRDTAETTGIQTILSNTDGTNGYHIYLQNGGEESYIGANMTWRSGLNVLSQSGIRAGVWTHVTVVYNDGATHLYINGQLDAEVSGTATALGSTGQPLVIGSNQSLNDEFFKGRLDGLRIYNTSRTAAQLQSDFNRILWGDENGLVGYWRFNEWQDTLVTSQTSRPITSIPAGSIDPEAYGSLPLPPYLSVRPDSGEVTIEVAQQAMGQADVFRYIIQRREENQNWQLLTSLTSGTNQYIDNNITPGTTYQYRASILGDQNGESDYRYPTQTTVYDGRPAGQALRFETNQNAHVQYEFNPSLDFAGRHMTVEAWVYKDPASQQYSYILANKSDGGSGYRMFLADAGDSSRVTFDVAWRSGLDVTSRTYLKPEVWYHVAAVYDAGNTRLFINGALDNSTSGNNTAIGRNGNAMVIGANIEGTDRYFIGEIDEVRIFNISVTNTMISNRYNRTLQGNETGLVGYWRFDEAGGTTAHSSAARPLEGQIQNGAQFVPSAAMQGDPYRPLLALPADGATDQPLPLTFHWHPVNNAVNYELEIAKKQNFETVILKKDITDTSATVELGLEYDSTYHWRVLAVTNQFKTNWSASRSFTVELPVPATPTWEPDSGATDVSTAPTLVWSEAARAETYRVQVSKHQDFRSTVIDTADIADTDVAVEGLTFNTTYYWRVQASNRSGVSGWSTARSFTTVTTALTDAAVPSEFRLDQNYPNPFNPTTRIRYTLPRNTRVTLEVYNMLGERITTLVKGDQQSAGKYAVSFDASHLSSGIYLYRLRTSSGFAATRQMVLVK